MQPKKFEYVRQSIIEQEKLEGIMNSTPIPIQDSPMPPPIEACVLGKRYYRAGREYPVDMLQGYRR
jgi:hypothetical protein